MVGCTRAYIIYFGMAAVLMLLPGVPGLGAGIKYGSYTNETCYRCHGSPTFGYISADYATVRSLYVDKAKFIASNHGRLNCKDCHGEKYLEFPHRKDSTGKGLYCTKCHSGQSDLFSRPEYHDKFARLRIEEIETEFNQSVHKRWQGEKMTCFSCHNPHEFDMHGEVTPGKIAYDNNMCLNCHADEAKVYAIAGKPFRPIAEIHEWLPNTRLHWKNVRCVDCHSSYQAPNRSHLILDKKYAVRDCEKCHNANSILMAKLYKYESKQAISARGFLNGAIFNNSYVIGSTRNEKMDKMSVWLAGLVMCGILIHSIIRMATAGKRRGKNDA